jgi:exopolyphosphatase/guanosine-5'-triphosphate,3'-diphosphate pyrophosphatase
MEPVRRAVIDVGTNSVKMLVGDVSARQVAPVWEGSRQTRLGRGFYETYRLQPEPVAATAAAVAEYAALARQRNARSIRVIATSAARDAVNSSELAEAIERASGLRLEIISGEQEADWAFQGVTTDPRYARAPILLMDTGGGSTEFILGRGSEKHFRRSYPLGTVRLLERIPHSDPPKPAELAACREWAREFLRREVFPELGPALRREVDRAADDPKPLLIGTGGTATILARMELAMPDYDRDRLEGCQLALERVRWHTTHLWSMALAERRQVVGLPESRADVILTGVVIHEAVIGEFGFNAFRVSTRGLRFGALGTGPLVPPYP